MLQLCDVAQRSSFSGCVTHPIDEERCSGSHACSIRPVWQMLQQRIDDVLESVCLADLLFEEGAVRERVGLARRTAESRAERSSVAIPIVAEAGARRGLPVLPA